MLTDIFPFFFLLFKEFPDRFRFILVLFCEQVPKVIIFFFFAHRALRAILPSI